MTHFADFEQFKTVSNFTVFRQVKIDITHTFTDFRQVSCFTEFGQAAMPQKTMQTLSV